MTSASPGASPHRDLPSNLVLGFAPLHKAAFGSAVGAALGLSVLFVTTISLLRDPEQTLPLGLLASYFPGYSVSWTGGLIGAAWAGFVGFVFGWFTAFCRNFVLAVSLFVIRTRAELAQTRDFLDHV